MGAILGLVIAICGLVIKILFKLRLLPAFLFLLITQIWFGAWAYSIGDWYMVITIAISAVGLGSFVVQGIKKHRRNQKLEKAYVERLIAKCKQGNVDELVRSGRVVKIDTLG